MEREDERRAYGRGDDTRGMTEGDEPAAGAGAGAEPAPESRYDYAEEPLRVRREGGPPPQAHGDERARQRDPWAVRAEDTEPYVGLQYVARLFKIVAMVVIVALTAEVVAGIAYEGAGAILQLFTEVIQGGVLAAMLWGASDLTLLFIDVGHDVRAARVLLGRLSARAGQEYAVEQRRVPGTEP